MVAVVCTEMKTSPENITEVVVSISQDGVEQRKFSCSRDSVLVASPQHGKTYLIKKVI